MGLQYRQILMYTIQSYAKLISSMDQHENKSF